MNHDKMALIRIRKEIELELEAHEKVKKEYFAVPEDCEGWIKIRTKASILHDFYTGIERILSRIAQELNGGIPNTDQWHRDLLSDMTLDLEVIRPPVISKELYHALLPFLRFRHLFRNLYGFELEWEKMKPLDDQFETVSARWFSEIRRFLEWMKSISQV